MPHGSKGVVPAYTIRATGVKVLGRRSKTAWYERIDSAALQAYLAVNNLLLEQHDNVHTL